MSEESAGARLKAHCRVMNEDPGAYCQAWVSGSGLRQDFADAMGEVVDRLRQLQEEETETERTKRIEATLRHAEQLGLIRSEGY